MRASGKRMIQLGAKSAICFPKSGGTDAAYTLRPSPANSRRSLCSNSSAHQLHSAQISPNGKFAAIRSLEAQGIPVKQAEAITSAVTEVFNESLKSISRDLISKAEMQKLMMAKEAKFSQFKSEVQSFQGQGRSLQDEVVKLQGEVKKMRSEIAEVTAGRRSGLNRERRSIDGENVNWTAEIRDVITELDRKHKLRDFKAAAKFDVMKFFGYTLLASSTVSLCITTWCLSKRSSP